MLAEGCGEWQVEKLPNSKTSGNAERQKVLPPPASTCHSDMVANMSGQAPRVGLEPTT